MLVIDADTSVAADSLNRLVSCAADDSRIIGICGETKLENEQASWWTMIQGGAFLLHQSYMFTDGLSSQSTSTSFRIICRKLSNRSSAPSLVFLDGTLFGCITH